MNKSLKASFDDESRGAHPQYQHMAADTNPGPKRSRRDAAVSMTEPDPKRDESDGEPDPKRSRRSEQTTQALKARTDWVGKAQAIKQLYANTPELDDALKHYRLYGCKNYSKRNLCVNVILRIAFTKGFLSNLTTATDGEVLSFTVNKEKATEFAQFFLVDLFGFEINWCEFHKKDKCVGLDWVDREQHAREIADKGRTRSPSGWQGKHWRCLQNALG
jgi:hypothetical protein